MQKYNKYVIQHNFQAEKCYDLTSFKGFCSFFARNSHLITFFLTAFILCPQWVNA